MAPSHLSVITLFFFLRQLKAPRRGTGELKYSARGKTKTTAIHQAKLIKHNVYSAKNKSMLNSQTCTYCNYILTNIGS